MPPSRPHCCHSCSFCNLQAQDDTASFPHLDLMMMMMMMMMMVVVVVGEGVSQL
jgi:hypothetical protein